MDVEEAVRRRGSRRANVGELGACSSGGGRWELDGTCMVLYRPVQRRTGTRGESRRRTVGVALRFGIRQFRASRFFVIEARSGSQSYFKEQAWKGHPLPRLDDDRCQRRVRRPTKSQESGERDSGSTVTNYDVRRGPGIRHL